MERTISETAAVIIGSLGRRSRVIAFKSGHSLGRVVTIDATIAVGRSGSLNLKRMEVVLGERNRGMNGKNDQ